MHLYSLTLQRSTAIVTACVGNFTGTKQQEIAVSRGKVLELLCPDENGKVQSLASYECFGIVRSIVAFRLTGAPSPPRDCSAQLHFEAQFAARAHLRGSVARRIRCLTMDRLFQGLPGPRLGFGANRDP